MPKPKYPRLNTKRAPRAARAARSLHTPRSSVGSIVVLIIVLGVLLGVYYSGINNGPAGKANCTPAEIAANRPCR